ncbi:MAG: dihydrolipoamide dehydrogenase [Steroidobacteraceae bacterium]|nr:dihydrolipoamide dehydrogenase [Steroidobacteraceae bacterium]
MSRIIEQRVPDLGEFRDVEVIEVLVKPGDNVEPESPLITLETDKATMDVPATAAGVVQEVRVVKGDRVSKGSLIAVVTAAGGDTVRLPALTETTVVMAGHGETVVLPGRQSAGAPVADDAGIAAGEPAADLTAKVLVIGAGPGGYTAAFRAADLGLGVILVDRWPQLGGVCLNVGCIPSKALLHAARVIEEAEAMSTHGIRFGKPQIDTEALKQWKNKIVGKLTAGLTILAKQRKVNVLRGFARFISPHRVELRVPEGTTRVIGFEHCIIAAGSEPARIPGLPTDSRVMDSTAALDLKDIPGQLLVIGGGIIGLEMACVYDALGSKVSVVELTDTLMPGCDRDLVRPLEKRLRSRYASIMTGTRVMGVEAGDSGLKVSFDAKDAPQPQIYDRVLCAVGRVPNGRVLNAESAGIEVDARGYIAVDRQQRTNVRHIFAIGDIVGQPMLAHKATHEGKVAAEVIAGHKRAFDALVIPSVAYTDPEIAWAGITETEAQALGRKLGKGLFPWMASGRSLALNRDDGFTKLLFDEESHRIVGGGIVGSNAGDLISEVALAIEMGADAADIGLTIHPHPTLSETVAFAAEAFDGTLTDLYMPKKS